MRGATALLAMLILVTGAFAAELSMDDCARHRDDFVTSLAENREASVRGLEAQLSELDDPELRERLQYEIEQVWEFEERMLARGDHIYRDCMAHVMTRKAGG